MATQPAVRISPAGRRAGRFAALGLALLALHSSAGCVATLMPAPNLLMGQHPGPFDAVPAALQTSHAEVIFLTDRDRDDKGNGPPRYGYKRSPSLAYGTARVHWGRISDWDTLCATSCQTTRLVDPTTRVESITELGRFPPTPWKSEATRDGIMVAVPEVRAEYERNSAALHKLIAERLAHTARKEAFVYVHGFNNRFNEVIPVIAEIWHFIGRIGVPIAYTWPAGSGFDVRGYNYDRESGEFTIFHLKQFLETLAQTPGLERVNLIAHSRGGDVLSAALRELNIKYRALFPGEAEPAARVLRIHHLVLAAPDIDLSIARQRLEAERLGRVSKRMTIYSSPDDLAIRFARWLFASTIRLGTLGFASLPAEERLALADLAGVDFIDARVSSDFVGHSYFYTNPAVSSDLILLLRDDRLAGAEHGRPLKHIRGSFWELDDDYPSEVRPAVQPGPAAATAPAAAAAPLTATPAER